MGWQVAWPHHEATALRCIKWWLRRRNIPVAKDRGHVSGGRISSCWKPCCYLYFHITTKSMTKSNGHPHAVCCAQVKWNVIPSARKMIFRWNISDACEYLLYTVYRIHYLVCFQIDIYMFLIYYLYLFTYSPIYSIVYYDYFSFLWQWFACYYLVRLLYILYLLVFAFSYITKSYLPLLLERERETLLSNVIVIAATMTLNRSYHHSYLLLLFWLCLQSFLSQC